ncbi:MAG: exosortase/archaeosortase family protein [Verrucomicrobiota bacterium]
MIMTEERKDKKTNAYACSGWWLAGGLLFWLAWSCADDWTNDPNYSHGWIILPLFVFFLFQRAKHFLDVEITYKKPGWISWVWLLPILILTVELVRLTPFYWRPVFWVIYFMLAAYSLTLLWPSQGKTAIRVLGFPLLFLATALPWPTAFELETTRVFSFFIADLVGEVLLLSGIYTEVQGRVIFLEGTSIGVDEACSGLRSLQSSLMVGLAVGEWFRLRIVPRTGLLLLSLVGAIL